MDYMEKITELRASKAKLNKQAQALVTEGKFEDANKLADQMEGINKQIQAVERLLDESRKHAAPLDGKYDGILHDEGTGKPKDGKKDAVKPFATLGEAHFPSALHFPSATSQGSGGGAAPSRGPGARPPLAMAEPISISASAPPFLSDLAQTPPA